MSGLPSNSQPWVIEILSGVDRGKKFILSRPEVKIGRDTGNHIVLSDLKISRNHVEFELRGDKIFLTNVSPHNQISLDGEATESSEYVPGQVLQIGETSLVLKKKDILPSEKKARPRKHSPSGPEPRSKNHLFLAIIVIVVLVIFVFGDGEDKVKDVVDVTSTSDIEKLVLESRERQRELKEKRSFASIPERKGFEAAEKQYNQGFRDFQRGNYSRAIQSFRAALSADRKHHLAQRYLSLSMRKKEETIDQSLLEGRRHYEKGMYSLCEATMAKVLVMINDEKDLKYQQADELRHECFLSKTVM